jgi:hypothetical protein
VTLEVVNSGWAGDHSILRNLAGFNNLNAVGEWLSIIFLVVFGEERFRS